MIATPHAARAARPRASAGETSMIDLSSLALLKGKKALVTGIANDQSIAWGCAKAFRASGLTSPSPISTTSRSPTWNHWPRRSRRRSSCHWTSSARASWRRSSSKIEKTVGQARPVPAFDRICTERGSAGPCRRLLEKRLPPCHGDLVLVVHPHGQAGRAADEGRRHPVHDDLLRLADGRRALQHHGPGEGRAGSRRHAIWRPSSAPRASGCTRYRRGP